MLKQSHHRKASLSTKDCQFRLGLSVLRILTRVTLTSSRKFPLHQVNIPLHMYSNQFCLCPCFFHQFKHPPNISHSYPHLTQVYPQNLLYFHFKTCEFWLSLPVVSPSISSPTLHDNPKMGTCEIYSVFSYQKYPSQMLEIH